MEKISGLVAGFLLNSAWQIIVIALVAWACSLALRNAAARYHHALWVAALVLSLALPLWGLLDAAKATPQRIIEQSSDARPARGSLPAASSTTPYTETATAEESRPSVGQLLQRRRQPLVAAFSLSLALAFGYALFFLYRLFRLWRSWLRARGLRQSAYARSIPGRINMIAAQCRAALELKDVPLVCSAKASAPVTIGASRPLIILPETFYENHSDETLTSVLGHEMAHVARRDYALNLVYEFIRLPISFHPLAKFIKDRIDGSRELACDELVTERLLDSKTYARALVRVAGALVQPDERALTLGIFDANILEERVMKLTRKTNRTNPRAGRLLALAAFSFLGFSCLSISTFSFELQTGERFGKTWMSSFAARETAGEQGEGIFLRAATSSQEAGSAAQARAGITQELSSGNAQERARGACEAGRRRAIEAIPTLVSMLGDDTPITPLKCWDNGRWSPALETFKQPSPGEEAAIALASMGTPAVEPLTNALNDSNGSVRRNAAWAIGELTNMRETERAKAVAPLISLLGDADEWVRMAAVRALGEIKDRRATSGLIGALIDSSWKVRELAAWSLGEMKEKRAVESLGGLLLEDVQAEVRETAAWALGEIKSAQATPFLNRALNDAETRVRDKARWALSEIEDSDG